MSSIGRAAIARPRAALALLGFAVLLLAFMGRDLEPRLAPTTLLTEGTESARAAELYSEEFGDGITIPVLLEGPGPELDRQGPALVRKLRAKRHIRVLSAWDKGPAGAALRPRERAALIVIALDRPLQEAVDAGYRRVRDEVVSSVREPVRPRITGLAAVGLGVKDSSLAAVARAEKLAIPILLLVLLGVFRSLVAAAIPAVFGGAVVVASMGTLSLLTRVTDLDAIAVSLASMMGLALGVDYSLLLVSRFREELSGRSGPEAAREAALVTSATAGRTVVFAGAVLGAAMVVALFTAPGDLLVSASMGVLAAVAVSVLVATAGIPAVLVLLGAQIDRGWIGPRRTERRSAPVRLAIRVLRRPAVPAALVLGALMLAAAPALALKTGPPDVRMLPEDSPVRADFEAVRDAMGPGWTSPFEVMVRVDEGTIGDRERLDKLHAWQERIARIPGVAGVVGPGTIAEQLPSGSGAERAEAGERLSEGGRQLARLKTGLGRAGDGVQDLREGLAEAASGAGRLEAGGREAAAGAARVESGLARAVEGAGRLVAGLREAHGGSGRLATGAGRTAAGAAELERELRRARREVAAGAARGEALPAGLRTGAEDLSKLRRPAQRTETELRNALRELDRMAVGKADPRYIATYTAVASALAAASGRHPITGQPVEKGYDGLDASLAKASTELARAADGAGELIAGTRRLVGGLDDLAAGARRLEQGAARLQSGARRLEDGLRRLAAGGGELDSGLTALSTGAARLDAGLEQLAGGAGRLEGGLSDGRRRTGALESGLEAGAREIGGFAGDDFTGLARSARRSPGLFESGYFTLAALDGTRGSERAGAEFAVSLARGGQAGRIMVVPDTGPNEERTAAVGKRLASEAQVLARDVGGQAAVGGAAAFLDDYDRVTSSRFPYLVLGIVLASILVLIPVFRSLLLPVIAVVLNLVTVGAAFGVLALLFQGDGPLADAGFIDAISASGIFCVLFGLSIDYQVFLITRMREGWDATGDTQEAIAHGLERTAGVVTGAAGIMLGVFAAFSLADVASIQQFGLGLALAVLIDATVVRLVLLPAAMRACGPWCWWLPGPLAARLPQVAA